MYKNSRGNVMSDILILARDTLICYYHVDVTAVPMVVHQSSNIWSVMLPLDDGCDVDWLENSVAIHILTNSQYAAKCKYIV